MKWSINEYNKWLQDGAPINEYITDLDISNSDIKSILEINNLSMLKTLNCSSVI